MMGSIVGVRGESEVPVAGAGVMSSTCRLTVITPRWRVDLAVPVDTPISDLLATLVRNMGPGLADEGAAHGGWVLQQLGKPALDPAATLSSAQVRDGDVLRLHPASSQLPELAFDDVLDAVATGVNERTPRWRPEHTERASVLFASAALTFALLTMLLTGPSWTAPSVAAGVTAVVLLGAAAALGRAFNRRAAAVTAGSFAVAFAGACAATALGDEHRLWAFGAAQLLPALCAAVLAAVVALIVLGTGITVFVAVIAAGLLGAIGTGVSNIASLGGYGSAALVAAITLACAPVLPMLAFRLSRLALPAVPASAEDLRRDTSRVDSATVLHQAVRADQYLTGLTSACAIAVGGSAALLATGSMSDRVLAGVLGAIMLLRARLFSGRGQRSAMLIGGGVAGLALVVTRALATDGLTRVVAFVVPAVGLAAAFLVLAVALPERRLAPTWGRFADIVESMLILSVIPLALGVIGVYGAVRNLSS
jgi:type VII secretion integral membrane protein EccD